MIHCIGDSHVVIFSGCPHPRWKEYDGEYRDKFPEFRTKHIGPALAYNLLEYNTTTKGREQINRYLSSIISHNRIIISLGEIDIRKHIIHQAAKEDSNIYVTTEICAKRYAEGIRSLVGNHNICARGMHPVDPPDLTHEYFLRFDICQIFNKVLADNDIKVLNIFDKVVNKQKQIKNQYYYSDKIHLNQWAIPFYIKELKRIGFL